MEHVSEIIPRAMSALTQTNGSPTAANGSAPTERRPATLRDLIKRFDADEAMENPDVVLPLSTLRMTGGDTIVVPRLGTFCFTDWSRRQCASLLGCRFDRWFENASPADRSDEMNRRLARATATVRLRTTRAGACEHDNGTLSAFVSSGYTPVPDARLGRLLVSALLPADPELRLVRSDLTDKTTSYVVKIGEAYHQGGPGDVGDVWGGILVRNSGVGFASLLISLHLTRLVCKNGMTAPLPNAILVRRRHRAIDDARLRELLASQLEALPERLARGAALLRAARDRAVTDVKIAVTRVLEHAGLPAKHLPTILAAYDREPEPSAFGISQAITLADLGGVALIHRAEPSASPPLEATIITVRTAILCRRCKTELVAQKTSLTALSERDLDVRIELAAWCDCMNDDDPETLDVTPDLVLLRGNGSGDGNRRGRLVLVAKSDEDDE